MALIELSSEIHVKVRKSFKLSKSLQVVVGRSEKTAIWKSLVDRTHTWILEPSVYVIIVRNWQFLTMSRQHHFSAGVGNFSHSLGPEAPSLASHKENR